MESIVDPALAAEGSWAIVVEDANGAEIGGCPFEPSWGLLESPIRGTPG